MQQNKCQPMYEMTRDGFTILAMGFTGKQAMEWKLKFLAAFNAMEQRIRSMEAPRSSYPELPPYVRELLAEDRLSKLAISPNGKVAMSFKKPSTQKTSPFSTPRIVTEMVPAVKINPYEKELERFLDGRTEMAWPEIARFLKLNPQDKSLQMKIGSKLRAFGWKRKTVHREGRIRKIWLRERQVS